jgi:GNAT superfamily N-acetyltransferase
MESTELELREEHLAGCLALSKSAHWNQNEADWRLMLGFGRGWGIQTKDGTLAASTVMLPYGADFGWIAMVLVLPEHRRQGYASRLLRVALAEMERQSASRCLTTPAGHEVYVQEGYDFLGFKRFSSPVFRQKKKRNPLTILIGPKSLRWIPPRSVAAGSRCCVISPRASRDWPWSWSAMEKSRDSCSAARAGNRCRSARWSHATTKRRAACLAPR